MSVVVFLGPTLPHAEAQRVLGADYRPPAAQGDVLRAALERPRAIGLVDGVFERVPSVWHKEILFALSEGVHVYGAASMGALRAAELDRFGMRGVGEVYRAYASGELEDDDEVAVAHADGAHGYRPSSDALVDVRATLDAAVGTGVVPAATARRVLERLAATFYADRLLARALDPADEDERRLLAWLPANRVDRKREDALALLRRLRDDLAAGLAPVRPAWTLQRTRVWEAALRQVDPAPAGGDPDAALSPWARQDALDEARARYGLERPEDVARWLSARGLDPGDLEAAAAQLAAQRARLPRADAL